MFSRRIVLLASVILVAACSRRSAPVAASSLPQTSGSLIVEGLAGAVTIIRDRWGIPHVTAGSPSDLFFAQGFVQAQDRLFQMDLWRRSVQGRLSEVLGANFVERDAMTRRIQYIGDMGQEWASYGDDTRAIAEAFVSGVNAWVDIALLHPPEEFVLAGWRPEHWTADDLVNRTDAFRASGNAEVEAFRARLVAAIGARRVDAWFPPLSGIKTDTSRDVDGAAVGVVMADALRRIGTAPVFSGFAIPFSGLRLEPDPSQAASRSDGGTSGSNAWAVGGARSATGKPLLAADPHRPFSLPATRYLVHLKAPGWNVIGATAPWLPGVAIGHNERLAWGTTSLAADVQDIYVEETNPGRPHQVRTSRGWVDTKVVADPIAIKGRQKVFEFEREYTPHGVLMASDREHGRVFTLRWSGFEPGTAAELGALGVDRAQSEDELRQALKGWKLPASTVVYADVDGRIGSFDAGWIPVRRSWNGELPVPGWTGRYEWQGWRALAEGPAKRQPSGSAEVVLSANGNIPRIRRLEDLLGRQRTFDAGDFKRMQLDTTSWAAQTLVPLLAAVSSSRADVEDARRALLAWDRRLTTDSAPATTYVLWERELRQKLAEQAASAVRDELASHLGASLVSVLTAPSVSWLGSEPARVRDRLIINALISVVDRRAAGQPLPAARWGQVHTALFAHPLAVTTASRARFNIGPFELPGYADTVMSTSGSELEASVGASLRAIFDLGDWDRSVVVNAPGQSEAWRSPHYADLAKVWVEGGYVPLVFSEQAVQANEEATLVLTPRQTR